MDSSPPFLLIQRQEQRQEQYIKMNLSFAVMQKFLDLAVVSTNGSESLSSYLLVMMSFFSGFSH